MTAVVRHARASVAEVFDAISDPCTYPEWLVGAREIRSVDEGWPAVGSRFHHRVGLIGPLTVADSTEVLEVEAPHRLVLEARARPAGRAKVTFTLVDVGADPGAPVTQITIDEVPIGVLAPTRPLTAAPTRHRNGASLNALVAYINDPTTTPARS